MTATMEKTVSLAGAVPEDELGLPPGYRTNPIDRRITVAPSLNLGRRKSPKSTGGVRGATAARRRSGTAPPGFRAGIPPNLLKARPIVRGNRIARGRRDAAARAARARLHGRGLGLSPRRSLSPGVSTRSRVGAPPSPSPGRIRRSSAERKPHRRPDPGHRVGSNWAERG